MSAVRLAWAIVPPPAAVWTRVLTEDVLFVAIASAFFALIGWSWRGSKPFSLPLPLPSWFRAWLLTVLGVGVVVPIAALLWWRDGGAVGVVLLPYLALLGLQIASESVALNRFRSCVWVTIPCVYLPYRVWQLDRGLAIVSSPDLLWVQRLLWLELALWIFNYGVHLSQLPRLLRWEGAGDRPTP